MKLIKNINIIFILEYMIFILKKTLKCISYFTIIIENDHNLLIFNLSIFDLYFLKKHFSDRYLMDKLNYYERNKTICLIIVLLPLNNHYLYVLFIPLHNNTFSLYLININLLEY